MVIPVFYDLLMDPHRRFSEGGGTLEGICQFAVQSICAGCSTSAFCSATPSDSVATGKL